MKKIFVFAAACIMTAATDAQTGNIGIGTTTPGSKLTVNGSFAAAYRAETGATAAIGANDYYVVWNGASGGTLTLPAAISGAGNYKGRLYFIKNTTTASNLTLAASAGEQIDGNASMLIPPGYGVNVVNTGATSGTSWEVVSFTSTNMPQFRTTSLMVNTGSFNVTGATAAPAVLPGMSMNVNNPTGQPLNYLINCNLAFDAGLGTPINPGTMYIHVHPILFVDGVATPFRTFIEAEPVATNDNGSSNLIGSLNGTVSLPPGNHTVDVRYVVSAMHNFNNYTFNQAGSVITATTMY